MRGILFRHVDKSTSLAEDVAHYRRCGIRHDDHSYKFLRDAIERAVDTSHQRKIVEERRTAIRAGRTNIIVETANPATANGTTGGTTAYPAAPGAEAGTTRPDPPRRIRPRATAT